MEDNRYIPSLYFNNGIVCEWKQEGNKYKLYLYDGLERRLANLNDLNNLPSELSIKKDGVFLKGNSDFKKWETRYFLVRGGAMTYFKDNQTLEPQGTIPLENCVIELPNEDRKSFVRLGRSGVNGYELKLTHSERRPFIFVFSSAMERNEWRTYLQQYIAQTFVSKEYRLSEAIESVKSGVNVKKLTGVVGLGNEQDNFYDESNKYFYIDWYSSEPREWCLRYSSTELRLVPSSSGQPCEYEFDSSIQSDILTLDRISKVLLSNNNGQKSIKLHIFNGSSCHPNGIGEVWNLVPRNESLVSLWVHAIKSALTLHETNIPTQVHRRSRTSMTSLRAQLTAKNEPKRFTRVSYFKEIYSIRHGNKFDLEGAGVKALAQEMTYSNENVEPTDHFLQQQQQQQQQYFNDNDNGTSTTSTTSITTNEIVENLPNPPSLENLQIKPSSNEANNSSLIPSIPSTALTTEQMVDTL